MKQEVPKFLVVSTIVLALAAGIFFMFRAGGTNEIPGPKIEVGAQAVPEYLKDKLPPELQQKIEAESREKGTVTQRATEQGNSAPAPGQRPY